jgi:DNA-binding NarL/FixJ family response regulator/tetratricopeptide (TPR) repeat protein/energy-coupling factor transporter ATP-binding protein EcfA2
MARPTDATMFSMPKPVTSDVLVGRRDELAVLDEMLGDLTIGTGGFLLVAGEAGVGKSRLMDVMAEMADERGLQMFVGNCVQFGDEKLPAAPVIEILGELAVTFGDSDLDTIFGPARADLAGLVPALGDLPSAGEPLRAYRLFELVYGVLTRLAARTPLVLVVEDLHWADRTTRDLIGFLASVMRKDPVLAVATYRSDDLHRRHPLLPALAELQRAVRPHRLDLAPFDLDMTAELSAEIRGEALDPAAVEAIHRRSGGNPFYLEELLAVPDSDGSVPTTLRDVVLSRSQTLDDDAVTLLRIASAVGSRIDEALLERVADLDRSQMNSALRQLVDGQFVVSQGDHFRFRHDLTREVFADELLPGERADLHERIAHTLQEIAPDRLGEIAHHWYQSGNQEEALRNSITAGEMADRRGATAEALLNFERALELWDRVPAERRPDRPSHGELLLLAAEAADLLQEFRRAIDLAGRAFEELSSADDTTKALALVRQAHLLWNAGEPGIDEAISLAMDLIETAPASPDSAWVLARAGGFDMLAGRLDRSIERCRAAIEMAQAVGNPRAESNARNTIAVCEHTLGRAGATEELKSTLAFALEIGDREEISRGYINLSELLFLDGEHEAALSLALEGLDYAEEQGYRGVCGAMLAENASHSLAVLGRWEELDELTERVLALRRLDLDVPAPTGLSAMAAVMVKRGETDRARPVLEHDLQAELTDSYCGATGSIISALIELDAVEGAPAANRELVGSAIDLLSARKDAKLLQVMMVALRAEADAATTAHYLGDDAAVAEIREAADRWIGHVDEIMEAGAEGPIDPDADVMAAQCRAEHSRAHGHQDPDLWAEVTAGWATRRRPWSSAYSKWREAEAILLAGASEADDRATARRLLIEAHATAAQLGAKPLMSDIQDLATRARIDLADEVPTPDAEPVAAPFALTPRELGVLELVAKGYSNGRIGKELFISTKTASVHVSNILRKLGAANRIEAAAIATTAGITTATASATTATATTGSAVTADPSQN